MRVEIEEKTWEDEVEIRITIDRNAHVDIPTRIRHSLLSPYGIMGWVDDTEPEMGTHIYNIPHESVPHMLVEWAYLIAISQQKKELEQNELMKRAYRSDADAS